MGCKVHCNVTVQHGMYGTL